MLKLAAPRSCMNGFTLIEAMLTIAILMIALGLAAPSFEAALASFRVRSGAEALMSGLQLARSEALRRNQPVSFSLAANSANWTVATVSPANTIQSASGQEHARLIVNTNANQTTVTFKSTGEVNDGVIHLQEIDISAGIAGIDDWRIRIFDGGQMKLCNASISTANDPRKC